MKRPTSSASFGIAFLDLLSCGLIAVLILLVASPQGQGQKDPRRTRIAFSLVDPADGGELPSADQARILVRCEVHGETYASSYPGDENVTWEVHGGLTELFIRGELPEVIIGAATIAEERLDQHVFENAVVRIENDGGFKTVDISVQRTNFYVESFTIGRS